MDFSSSSQGTSSFQDQVENALKKFTDEAWLGNHSPLATPYFLGERIQTDSVTPTERGRVLQALLKKAANNIPEENADRIRRLLQIYYFDNMSVQAARDRLVISKAQFHNDRNKAVARLAESLIAETRPALRLEALPTPPVRLEERQVAINRLSGLLNKNQAVYVTGTGGIGKTALGCTIAKRVRPDDSLWYTFRPSLNDHLSSFIFAFGYFCYLRGAAALWQEVIAAEGLLPKAHLLEVMRYTLSQLSSLPLLCLDEVDLLNSSKSGDHAQLLQLFSDLRGLTPMLLMGQKITFEADHFEELTPLTSEGISNILAERVSELTPSDLKKLETELDGNPRLVELTAILLNQADDVESLEDEIKDSPSVQFLLGRILLRLDEVEVGVLMDLAVYETVAPLDIWLSAKDTAAALTTLVNMRLVHFDESGGAFLLPAYREILLNSLPDEKIEILHRKAADAFVQRGRITQAARHYASANEPEIAIQIWGEFRQQEVSQGQAHAALSLFEELKQEEFPHEMYEQIVLHIAYLKQLLGLSKSAQDDLNSVLWRTPVLQVEANVLSGIIQNDKNDFASASSSFTDAISIAEGIMGAQLAHSHKGLGWGLMQERHLDRAWNEALLAQYEAIQLQGNIELMRQHYENAKELYLSALVLSHQSLNVRGTAKTYNQLSLVSTLMGDFEGATEYAQKALECFEQTGEILGVASTPINIAMGYNLLGKFEEAIQELTHSLTQFKKFNLTLPPIQNALINQGLAEAYLGLNQFEKAIGHTQHALDLEEISVLPDSLRTYGEILLKMGDIAEAKKWIQSSIDLIIEKNQSDNYLLGYAWRAMAQVYLAQGNGQLAIEAKDTAIELFEDINLNHEVERTRIVLVNI